MATKKVRIKLEAFDLDLINKSVEAIVEVARKNLVVMVGPVPLPTKIRRYTVLRSPFVNKTSREQFETRTHRRLIDIIDPAVSVMETLMKLQLPAGVGVEIG